MRSKNIIVPFFCLIFVTMTSSVRGENLSEVYELALKNDPLLRAAEASYRSGKENKAQGIAGLLPTLSVSGSTNWNEYRVEEQLIDQYNSNAYFANLNQPIFRSLCEPRQARCSASDVPSRGTLVPAATPIPAAARRRVLLQDVD